MELRPCSSGLGQGFSGEKNADSIASLKSEIRNPKFETISKFLPREVLYDFDTSLGQMFKIQNTLTLSCSRQRRLGFEHWDFGLPREMRSLFLNVARNLVNS